jgi:hypothetical protein
VTTDAITGIQRNNGNTRSYAYADDMTAPSTSVQHLQHFLMNTEKTEMMVFWKGMKVMQGDRINYKSGEVQQICGNHPLDQWQDLQQQHPQYTLLQTFRA